MDSTLAHVDVFAPGLPDDNPNLELLDIDQLICDDYVQSRLGLNHETVKEYAERMKQEDFPPIGVFFDGETYWLGAGFHRIAAYKLNGVKQVLADVRRGGKREARYQNFEANRAHGLPITRAARREHVMFLLADETWRKRSNVWVARESGVDDKTVGKLRDQLDAALACGQVRIIKGKIVKYTDLQEGQEKAGWEFPPNIGNSEVDTLVGEDGKERPRKRQRRERPMEEKVARFTAPPESDVEPVAPLIPEKSERPLDIVAAELTKTFAFVHGLDEQFPDPADLFELSGVKDLSLGEKQEFANSFMLMVETVKDYGQKFRLFAQMHGLLPDPS